MMPTLGSTCEESTICSLNITPPLVDGATLTPPTLNPDHTVDGGNLAPPRGPKVL